MKRLEIVLLFTFISLLGYNQNNDVKKELDEHKKIEKEIDQILERNQSDSIEINLQGSEQAIPESEANPNEEPKPADEAPLAPPAPSPSKNKLNIKSEPVPGAEIIIDKIPASDKKKNKIKSTLNEVLPNSNDDKKTNENKNKNE